MEIDVALKSFRTLIEDLPNTKETSQLSLASCLDTIVSSIVDYKGPIN
jgi:hypothetical protein